MPAEVIPFSELAIGRLRPSISTHKDKPEGYGRMDNCWGSREVDGAIDSVPGFVSISAASQALRGLVYAKASTGVKLLLAVGATKLFSVSLADATYGNFTELATGLTYGQEFGYVIYDDAIYLFNGATPRKITIVASPVVSAISVDRPAAADVATITTARAGSGKVRGTVKYFLAEVTDPDAGDEGAISVAFGQINAKKGKKIDITFPNDAAFNSKTFRIYRTYENGEDPFSALEVDVGASGGTFTDNVPDEGEDALGDPPLLNGDPPPDDILASVMHLNRAWALGDDSLLYYSDVNHPDSWFTAANGNIISVFKNDGDSGTALGVDGDDLIIWKANHMYRLVGLLEEEFALRRITRSTQDARNIGTPSINSVTAVPGGFVFYWKQAIYTYFQGRIRRISDEIEKHFTSNLDLNEDQIHLGYDSFNERAWASLPINGQRASHVYFYDFKESYWTGRAEYGIKSYTYVEDNNDNLRLWGVGVN